MSFIHLLRKYIKDAVYGANDGIITTFAIVSSIEGANLGVKAILIVGFASLLADGLSMASSDYLATRAELANKWNDKGPEKNSRSDSPRTAAIFTFMAFTLVGIIPLVPYFFAGILDHNFAISGVLTALALFGVGALRTKITGGNALKAGSEMLIIGGSAAIIAFFVGKLIENWQ